jgi:hypothetical protein
MMLVPGQNSNHDISEEDAIVRKLQKEFDTGSFYWYGTDNKGSPNLWYRVERMEWDSIVLKKRIEYTKTVLQSVLNNSPNGGGGGGTNAQDLNFILLFDDFTPIQIMKHPKIGPAFLKSFIENCGNNGQCLKSAIMVTGSAGHIFYKIAKSIAPKSFMDKITVVKSRESAARLLVDRGILVNDTNQIPTFLGGELIHPDSVTKSLYSMVSSVKAAIMKATRR